jgi:hypothetical protein
MNSNGSSVRQSYGLSGRTCFLNFGCWSGEPAEPSIHTLPMRNTQQRLPFFLKDRQRQKKKGVRTKYVVLSCARNKLNVKD